MATVTQAMVDAAIEKMKAANIRLQREVNKPTSDRTRSSQHISTWNARETRIHKLYEAYDKARDDAARLKRELRERNPDILDTIRPGMRVTIVDRFGKESSGKAVMRGPAGWVLNMGGPHGTPGIATPENIVKVSGKASARSLFGSRIMNPRAIHIRGGNYAVGDFYIAKAGYLWVVMTREGKTLARAGTMQGATKKANQFMKHGVVIENPAGSSAIPTKGMWTVRSWQGDTGQFSTRKAAQQYCTRRREADRQAGNKVDARVVRANPTRTGGPSAIPTKWTPATVSRKGRQIQIRMGGR